MKKIFLVFCFQILSYAAFAVPIVNENVANSDVMTIYPDHADPHRFYVAPNVVMIAKNDKAVPLFAYTEYRRGLSSRVGIVTMTLVPAYTRDELEKAKADILVKDPAAIFSGVPFIESKLELTGILPELIEKNDCNHVAGLIGQEQSCSFVLTGRGRVLFLKALERRTLFLTLQFQYSVQALIRKADGTLGDQVITHGIAVRIDGDQLSKYPHLIRRL
ncbi:MAG: hypothetical protein H7326_06620 [Bdellovibrionaceae bacterium]|nr:hypothetical protein [Pseudobdellovibrionaceae bacterium]